MNKIQRNKFLLIGISLFAGITIGYFITRSSNHQITKSELQQMDSSEIWTCSMHPQVRLPEPGDCPICGMDLIPASSGRSDADANPMIHEMTPEAVSMANIHTSRVSGSTLEGEIFLTGKVQVDERQLASVAAQFPGQIERLFVNFTGQVIRAGERVATIYSPDLVNAQKELLEAVSSKETFPELYAASREKLRLWKLSEKQIDDIEKTGSVSNQFDILADKGGVVTKRNISVGDYVNTGSNLFDIVDLSRVWIMMDAYETDLPSVKLGNELSFTATGIPGKTFTARVTYIDPVINARTRVASVRAEVDTRSGDLIPEMFVHARVRTTISKNQSSLSIPRTALLWSGKRSIVYVKVPDSEFPAFEMREITIGPRMGEMYLVEAGLEAGEEIVTNGVFAIDAAAQLSGNYSMLMRPDSKTMEVSGAFRLQITSVAEEYFKVKNALANDDAQAAKLAISKVKFSLGKVDMKELQGQAHEHWMALEGQLSGAIDMMEKSEKLEDQRIHFVMLSENILDMTESFGLEMDKAYKVFCPMAFENKGAYWLSETEDILNPYFGESMLTCGEVKETYRKGQRVFDKNGPGKTPSAGGHNH